jgi:hypothetical protein
MNAPPATPTRPICLLLLLLWAWPDSALAKKDKTAPDPAESAEYTALFSAKEPPRIQITIATNEMAILRKAQWTFGSQAVRDTVTATIREGGREFSGVALRLKGSAGSFRSVDDKPALTLHFDKFVKGQHFHGLRKLSLNNSVQDPTYLSEEFCRELFLEAGVPVPRARPARVELNGRDLGVYVLVEGWDREFLQRNFKDPSGTLYDGGFTKDVADSLTLNSGATPPEQPERKALVEAARESDPARRLARLNEVLDVEKFLTFVALDVMLWDWDGYAMNHNNWRLYHDPSTGKMVFMPHGMDQMLWQPEGGILPPMQGLVAKALLDVPEARRRYLARLQELRTQVFNVSRLTNRVQQIAVEIAPVLAQTPGGDANEYWRKVDKFRDAVVRRGASIDYQLAHPPDPPKFDAAGLAALGGWVSQTNFGAPSFLFDPPLAPRGSVGITALDGSSIGSLKTTVWLERGKYILQGRMKTQGIAADPGDSHGGAGLLAQGNRQAGPILGDSDWQTIETEISVSEAMADTPIVCEFRGSEGAAWFDLPSFKLKRVAQSPSQ